MAAIMYACALCKSLPPIFYFVERGAEERRLGPLNLWTLELGTTWTWLLSAGNSVKME